MLVICLISFVINRKNKFAVVSFAWIAFSFVILGLVGWGSKENGMILYSYYFGWAFISLIVLLIEFIPKKLNILKYSLYGCAIIALLVFNTIGFAKIIQFGIEYYPR